MIQAVNRELWVSIDPGGVHVGMAWWCGEELRHCYETTPLESMRKLEQAMPAILVIEEFRLYPSKAKTLTGSTMETAQLIGAMTWWANRNDVAIYMQPAAIKEPTRSYMRKYQLELVKGKGDHAQDAQVHGIQWLIRGQGKEPTGSDLF